MKPAHGHHGSSRRRRSQRGVGWRAVRTAARAAAPEVGEEVRHQRGTDLIRGVEAPFGEELRVAGQVTAVGREGVPGRAALDCEMVQVAADGPGDGRWYVEPDLRSRVPVDPAQESASPRAVHGRPWASATWS